MMIIFFLFVSIVSLYGGIQAYDEYQIFECFFLLTISLISFIFSVKEVLHMFNEWLNKVFNFGDNTTSYYCYNNPTYYNTKNDNQYNNELVNKINANKTKIQINKLNNTCDNIKKILKSVNNNDNNILSQTCKKQNNNSVINKLNQVSSTIDNHRIIYDAIIEVYDKKSIDANIVKDNLIKIKRIIYYNNVAKIYINNIKDLLYSDEIKTNIAKCLGIQDVNVKFIQNDKLDLIDYYINKIKKL